MKLKFEFGDPKNLLIYYSQNSCAILIYLDTSIQWPSMVKLIAGLHLATTKAYFYIITNSLAWFCRFTLQITLTSLLIEKITADLN